MRLYKQDVPVAFSMVALLEKKPPQLGSPFDAYSCCWIAFNNIYTYVAERNGLVPSLNFNKQGKQQFKPVAHIPQMAKIKRIDEAVQIDEAIAQLDDALKHQLIIHPATAFFERRKPKFKGVHLRQDAFGNRINGVLNVGYTVDYRYPVWSPIDPARFAAYVNDKAEPARRNPADRDQLTEQIVKLLYTVRNNTFHGGKRADDTNDVAVVRRAFPLLKMIVDSFLAR